MEAPEKDKRGWEGGDEDSSRLNDFNGLAGKMPEIDPRSRAMEAARVSPFSP